MKESIRIPIYKKRPGKSLPFGPVLNDSDFDTALCLALELGLINRKPFPGSIFFQIMCEKIDELDVFLAKLESLGWKASRKHVEQGEKETFSLRTMRTYSEDDIEGSELLSINSFGSCCTGIRSKNGWTGFTREMQSWDRPVLSFGLFTYFVSDTVKTALERAEININFSKLNWDNPGEEKSRYWELQSNTPLPNCLLPIVDTGDGLHLYFEEGYDEAELSFNRSEMKNIEDIGAAYCCETIGNKQREDMGKHMLIVSQEFREVFKSLLIEQQINFRPVRLQ